MTSNSDVRLGAGRRQPVPLAWVENIKLRCLALYALRHSTIPFGTQSRKDLPEKRSSKANSHLAACCFSARAGSQVYGGDASG